MNVWGSAWVCKAQVARLLDVSFASRLTSHHCRGGTISPSHAHSSARTDRPFYASIPRPRHEATARHARQRVGSGDSPFGIEAGNTQPLLTPVTLCYPLHTDGFRPARRAVGPTGCKSVLKREHQSLTPCHCYRRALAHLNLPRFQPCWSPPRRLASSSCSDFTSLQRPAAHFSLPCSPAATYLRPDPVNPNAGLSAAPVLRISGSTLARGATHTP